MVSGRVESYTAEDILDMTYAGDLFTGPKTFHDEYHRLCKAWHPDVCKIPLADEVLRKINRLYKCAQDDARSGGWRSSSSATIDLIRGKLRLSYRDVADFEIGKRYVTEKKVVYVIPQDRRKYVDNMERALGKVDFPDSKSRDYFGKFVPRGVAYMESPNGTVISMDKPSDVYPMSRVLEAMEGNPDRDKHVVWMISRVLNLAMMFSVMGIVHNGICIEDCFVSPKDHTVFLFGGWWYATGVGEPMIGTPASIYGVMSSHTKATRRSSTVTDVESVKLLGRQLFGHPNVRELLADSSIPSSVSRFLASGSSDDVRREIDKWSSALDTAWGGRKFIDLELTADEVYRKRMK